jgi:hypothetical protein
MRKGPDICRALYRFAAGENRFGSAYGFGGALASGENFFSASVP